MDKTTVYKNFLVFFHFYILLALAQARRLKFFKKTRKNGAISSIFKNTRRFFCCCNKKIATKPIYFPF